MGDTVPEIVTKHPELKKYWDLRHTLFTKYDEGIQLDYESWFSVTPEAIAKDIAEQCYTTGTVIDAFCGCGGNSIQFAIAGRKVISIDLDPVKIEMAKHNAKIYGVEDKITFVVGDFMKLAPFLKADIIFLSPPWGGPDYATAVEFDLKTMIPMDGYKVFALAKSITDNIVYFVPKNTSQAQLIELAGGQKKHVRLTPTLAADGSVFVLTAYYGRLVLG